MQHRRGLGEPAAAPKTAATEAGAALAAAAKAATAKEARTVLALRKYATAAKAARVSAEGRELQRGRRSGESRHCEWAGKRSN